jgi:hypothetical protein
MDGAMMNIALEYLHQGFSVIPMGKAKVPFVKWAEFETRLPTEDEIRKWWDRWPEAGIAVVTGKISNLTVVDFDLYKEGAEPIPQGVDCLEIPTAPTPRGGKHLYFSYDSRIPNKADIAKYVDGRNDGNILTLPPTKNGSGSYEWLIPFDRTLLIPVPEAIINKINSYSLSKGVSNKYQEDNLSESQIISLSLNEGTRNQDLFHVANLLYRGGASDQEVRQVIEIVADRCDPPYPHKELRPLIVSAKQRKLTRIKSIAETVREFCEVSRGIFKVSDYHMEYHIVSKEDKHAAILEFQRLLNTKPPIIKKHGNKRGEYQTVDMECEDIDYLSATEERMEIKLPLDIHELVEIMPGNIIILAGEPNAGKTSWIFNFVKMNMYAYDITYFNSEMAPEELKKRLMKIEDVPIDGWRWKVKGNAENYADHIVPGKGNINIIDYLEIYKDFYEAGGNINEIYRKLDGALAIIAIQKNPGTNTGLGGYRTLEKARLALALSRGRLDIVKAKNWATSENPNGKYCEFKIIQGGHMYATTGWLRDKK